MWRGNRGTPQGSTIFLFMSMRPFDEGLWRSCTFIRSSHFPPPEATKPISLEDERETTSARLNTYSPIPQAVSPRRRRGTALASFSRNALEGCPSEGFCIGNIARACQRHIGSYFPPQLHRRFHFLIVRYELPKLGQTLIEHRLSHLQSLWIPFDG